MALPNSKKRKIFDGRYEVVAIVGRGTDSVVYHARHASSPTQEVALKVLLSQKDKASVTERLRKEALTLVSCRHRYVVRLDDFHSIGDLCYLSMEYAQEGDLRKYVAKLGKPLSADTSERFLRQSLEALDFVHATGVTHRDVKPDNILVLNEKEIRLADFGLALLPGDEPSIEEIQSGVGSFGYLPPEVLEGTRYDQRSDLYALGLCFYEMLSGKHPFDQAPMAMQLEVRSDSKLKTLHEIDASIPKHLSMVIAKLMKFEASDRFQSALEALKALNNPDAFEANSTTGAENSGIFGKVSDTKIEAGTKSNSFDDPFSFDDDFLDDDADSLGSPANEDLVEKQESPSVEEPAESALDEDNSDIEDEDESNLHEGGERIPQPTEKIDLERIKEIIAKDAKQKAEAASRRASRERAAAQAAQKVHASNGGKARPAPPPTVSVNKKNRSSSAAGSAGGSFFAQASAAYSRIPHAMRPLAVGAVAAIVTIVLVSTLQFLPFGSAHTTAEPEGSALNTTEGVGPDGIAVDGSTEVAANGVTGEPAVGDAGEVNPPSAQNANGESGNSVFPQLPDGMYAGRIQGVIPGVTSPFTLVSLGKQQMLAVIVGIEGWTPVMVSQIPDAGSPHGTIVARSNGIILNITGLGSSDTIEGTFSNAVTGESGAWQVRKVS